LKNNLVVFGQKNNDFGIRNIMSQLLTEQELVKRFIAELRQEQSHLSERQIKKMVEILICRALSTEEYYDKFVVTSEVFSKEMEIA